MYPVLDEAWADRECAEPLCTPWDVAERVLDIVSEPLTMAYSHLLTDCCYVRQLSCLVPVEMICGEWEWTPAKIVVCIILTPHKYYLETDMLFFCSERCRRSYEAVDGEFL